MSPAARPADVKAALDALGPIRAIASECGLRFYDGMIVAAAERGGCGRIWSEDFNPGQKYFGVAVENPFA